LFPIASGKERLDVSLKTTRTLGCYTFSADSTADFVAESELDVVQHPDEMEALKSIEKVHNTILVAIRLIDKRFSSDDRLDKTGLLTAQDTDERRDVKKVDRNVLINVCFGLKLSRGQNRDERCDIKKVDRTVQVDISQQH